MLKADPQLADAVQRIERTAENFLVISDKALKLLLKAVKTEGDPTAIEPLFVQLQGLAGKLAQAVGMVELLHETVVSKARKQKDLRLQFLALKAVADVVNTMREEATAKAKLVNERLPAAVFRKNPQDLKHIVHDWQLLSLLALH